MCPTCLCQHTRLVVAVELLSSFLSAGTDTPTDCWVGGFIGSGMPGLRARPPHCSRHCCCHKWYCDCHLCWPAQIYPVLAAFDGLDGPDTKHIAVAFSLHFIFNVAIAISSVITTHPQFCVARSPQSGWPYCKPRQLCCHACVSHTWPMHCWPSGGPCGRPPARLWAGTKLACLLCLSRPSCELVVGLLVGLPFGLKVGVLVLHRPS